jgi:phosphomethylpyrimidine synthase
MSIREDARNNTKTPLFEACAAQEGIEVDTLIAGVADGTIAIPKNVNHHFDKIMAVGKGTSTKVNANIGSSKDHPEAQPELQKLCVSLKAGADTVMDLSMGGDLNEVRRAYAGHFVLPYSLRETP